MRKTLPLSLLAASLILSGAGCLNLGPAPVSMTPVTLTYWRTEDDPAAMNELITAYQKVHPNIKIDYVRMATENYEQKLLEAFAEDRAPDMFSIPNTWLPAWKSKLLPMPPETTIPTQTVNQQKKIVVVNKKTPTITVREMRNTFVEAVVSDVVMQGPSVNPGGQPTDRIYGLPLSVDTLALYYNKDLLKIANIEAPPATWSDLLGQSEKMTILEDDVVKQAGAAIGGAGNVRHYTDILSALMMQNGAQMAADDGSITFAQYPPGETYKPQPPGVEALKFYISFAVPGTENYCWNKDMPDSLDAFVTGRAAFYFGFPYDSQLIAMRAPKLNFAVAKLPQVNLSKVVNIAQFPVEVVSGKTKHANETWDFLQFITQQDNVSSFLAAAKRPTALRALIKEQSTNPEVGPFADQLLTAKTWYKGINYAKAEQAFTYMIDFRPSRERPEYLTAVSEAAAMVSDTLY